MATAALALAHSAVAASAQSPDVGSVIADPADVARVFVSVCVDPADLQQAQGVLRDMGMLDNPETGTFFHQTFDLSINPSGGTCSVVFNINQPEDVSVAAFRAEVDEVAGSRARGFYVEPLRSGEDTYVRGGIGVTW